MVTRKGQAIRFPIGSVPRRSRLAGGVKGVTLNPGDEVVTAGPTNAQDKVLVVTRQGYGKLTLIDRFRRQSRAGKGVKSFRISGKTGLIADAKVVTTTEGTELVLVSAKSQVTRISLDEVSVQGRIARGARVWQASDRGDHLVAVACYSARKKEGPTSSSADRPPKKSKAKGNGSSPEA